MTSVKPSARRSSTASTSGRARGGESLLGRAFAGIATGSGMLILAVLAAVAAFLVIKAMPAITSSPAQLAEKISWFDKTDTLLSYTGPMIFGTLLAGALALLIATPIAIGIALFISHYAPRRLSQGLGYIVDLLAAIPSVVYGLWGVLWLVPKLVPGFSWLSDVLGWLPFFEGPPTTTGRAVLAVGLVLAVMILPIITAVSREVFLQTPVLHEEAALALGATRWEMIRMAVFPFGRSGLISAAMLGLGRALGETMAVLMILSPGFSYSFDLIQAAKHQTIAANIAAQFPEANPTGVSVLITTGLALFVITMVVNMTARWIVSRRSEFSGAN